MPPKKLRPDAIELVQIEVERRIHVVRGVRVMLDFELAELYGVPTMRLNEQVSRDLERFPPDFSFVFEGHDVTDLISQNAISSSGYGGRRKPPRAFTLQGIALLSSVLRSETAVRVNIAIMRAFVRMQRLFATPGDIVTQVQQLAETVQIHDSQIKAVIDALQRMLAPPPDGSPKRRIGFTNTTPDTPTEEKQ